MSIRKMGYYHVKTIATAIEKKQGSSMVLHGGQAKLTRMSIRRWVNSCRAGPGASFGTGASCGGSGSGSGSCGSGSSASSTPAVVTSSSALPKRFVMLLWNWAGQVLPEATGQRLSKTGCQNLWQERQKPIILWWMSSPSFQRQNVCLRLLHWSLMLYNISSKLSTRFDFTYIEFKNLDLFKKFLKCTLKN